MAKSIQLFFLHTPFLNHRILVHRPVINRQSVLEEKQKIIEKEPLEDEELEVFLKESEEIRAEPEVSRSSMRQSLICSFYQHTMLASIPRKKTEAIFLHFSCVELAPRGAWRCTHTNNMWSRCFLKYSQNSSDAQFGGLGPGMFGEFTLYSFVVCRNNKRWVIKKRFSQFHTLDQQLLQAVKDAGGLEANLPEVDQVCVCARV